MVQRFILLLSILFGFVVERAFSAEITAEPSCNGAIIKIDGQLFVEYRVQSGNKPILWPIIGPTGMPVTRDFPMHDRRGEAKDHPHQRSLWFAHGDVNGVNFWCEPETLSPGQKQGTVEHQKFMAIKSGKPAIIETQNAWMDCDGKKVCEDRRLLRFDTDGDARWIDFDITIHATGGPVTFADNKEGTFALRLALPMTVDARQGGEIINSHGQTNADAWGKQASWVDDHGPIDGQVVGVAVFNHPSSFGYPTYWHARTYGLLAANPFAVHAMAGTKNVDGSFTIPSGESIALRYRVYLHRGNEKEGKVAEAYSDYAKQGK